MRSEAMTRQSARTSLQGMGFRQDAVDGHFTSPGHTDRVGRVLPIFLAGSNSSSQHCEQQVSAIQAVAE